MCQTVTSYLSYSERVPLQRRSSIQCIVTIHKCHQQSSVSVSVFCSKRLLHVNVVYSPVLLTSNGERKETADEAIGVKKGGIYVVFQPPFLSMYAVSTLVLVVCNMRGSPQLRLAGQVIAEP